MFVLHTQKYGELRLRFAHGGRFLVVSDEVWDLADRACVKPYDEETLLGPAEWHPGADELYAPHDSDLHTLAPDGAILRTLPDANARWIRGLAFTPAGDRMFTFNPFLLTGWKRFRKSWRPLWAVDVKKTHGLKNDTFESLAAFPDGRRVLTLILRRRYRKGESNPYSSLFVERDADTGEVLGERPVDGKDSPRGTLTDIAITPDNARVIGFTARSVLEWALDSDAPPRRTPASKKDVRDAALHPSGRWVLVASNTPELTAWDTTTWKPARTFDWKIGPVACAAFSPDGHLAATMGEAGKVAVWDWDV